MAENLIDQAKDFIQDKAGEILKNPEEIKKKVTEVGQKIAPDSLDPKVEEVVDKTVDFLTDKLLKQYSEAFIALIPSIKAGKLDEAANKKFLDLQSQLDQLDKNGQLSATQKDLFKVTTDTYNKMKK